MVKLLHIHSNIIFIDHSRRFTGNDQLQNNILFLGAKSELTEQRLSAYGISFRILDTAHEGVADAIAYANEFNAVIFHCLNEDAVRILLHLDKRVKTFLKLFGQELYMLKPGEFLSGKTMAYEKVTKRSLVRKLVSPLSALKRRIKIAFGKEYFLQLDNQERIFKRLDGILVISKFEYDELHRYFYLPKLIERRLVDQLHDVDECRLAPAKSNSIIVGNSGHRWNNHLDILEIIKSAKNVHGITFSLFFSYGTDSSYSKEVRRQATAMKHVGLIEEFLDKSRFDAIYISAAALVINSYRQHAIGNVIAGIKNGCKIYLNKKSSTYHWLISESFLIAEVDELKADIETGNIKLDLVQQQHNFDCLARAVKAYSVNDYVNNVMAVIRQ